MVREIWSFSGAGRWGLEFLLAPGFPAFPDRLRVGPDIDILEAAHAVLNRFGRIFIALFDRSKEWPQKGKRQKTPINVTDRSFDLWLPLFRSSSVTQRPPNRQAEYQGSQDCWHRIFSQKKLSAVASLGEAFTTSGPDVTGRTGNSGRRI